MYLEHGIQRNIIYDTIAHYMIALALQQIKINHHADLLLTFIIIA